jgi:hypothetical protein
MACTAQGEESKNSYENLIYDLKETDHLKDLGVDQIVLKWVFNK